MIEDRLLRQDLCWAHTINLNESIASNFSELFVQFTSRSAFHVKGFKAKYSIVDGECISFILKHTHARMHIDVDFFAVISSLM